MRKKFLVFNDFGNHAEPIIIGQVRRLADEFGRPAGDVAQRKFDRWNCQLNLARAPTRPKKPGGLAAREPAITRQTLRRQRNHHGAPMKPLLGMVPYCGAQIFEITARATGRAAHRRISPATSPLKSPPASLPPKIRSGVLTVLQACPAAPANPHNLLERSSARQRF
jgi:hypothetical protein